MRLLSSLNPLAPTAVEARGHILDACMSSDASIWNQATRLACHGQGGDATDARASSNSAVELICDELHKRAGIVCAPSGALVDLYFIHLVDAIQICLSVAAAQEALVLTSRTQCTFTIADFAEQIRMCHRRKMEAMAFVLADEIGKHAELLDDEEEEATCSLFDSGVVPPRDADDATPSDCDSDSESDSLSAASDNESLVQSIKEARQELSCDQELKKAKATKKRTRLMREAQEVLQDVEDIRGEVEELWNISDKINVTSGKAHVATDP